jgi:hypothetical protein
VEEELVPTFLFASHFPYNSQTKHNFSLCFFFLKMQFISICQFLIILPISSSVCWDFFEPAIGSIEPVSFNRKNGGIFNAKSSQIPRKILQANDRGIYEFELVVDYRLSMTLLMPNGTSPVLDYSPEKVEENAIICKIKEVFFEASMDPKGSESAHRM